MSTNEVKYTVGGNVSSAQIVFETGGGVMMTEEQATELGKRAVAAGLSMMAGMLIRNDKCDIRIESVDDDVILYSGAYGEEMAVDEAKKDFWPDFRDPATLGCLLAQVREAWGEEGIYAYRAQSPAFEGQWSFGSFRYVPRFPRASRYSTEAEALVACLEAAAGDRLAAARRAVTAAVLNTVDCEDTPYPKHLETKP